MVLEIQESKPQKQNCFNILSWIHSCYLLEKAYGPDLTGDGWNYEIWGSSEGDDKKFWFLGRDVVSSANTLQAFRRNGLLPSSGKMFTVYRDFGDNTFLRNVPKSLPDYTALLHRRQYSSVVAVFMALFQSEMSAGHFSGGKNTLKLLSAKSITFIFRLMHSIIQI